MKNEVDYKNEIFCYGELKDFFGNNGIYNIERLESIWRKENLLLKIDTHEGSYVFKKINGEDKLSEIQRIQLMKRMYSSLYPELYFCNDEFYLMEFIDGKSFFQLDNHEKESRLKNCGRLLNQVYSVPYQTHDIRDKIQSSFQKYRQKRSKYFNDDELRFIDVSMFSDVPLTPSHNDLNAANLIYTSNGIKMIDPSDEGFEDFARDIGRYAASVFFNNYDYFGQDKFHSLQIVDAFLTHFDESTLSRAKYFMGESFLSFTGFDTISTPKSILKKLSINLLQKEGKIINLLQDCI